MNAEANDPVGAVEIPQKLYFSIGEVKEITRLEPYVLRYWETEFPALRPKKSARGHRQYQRKDIELILTIKDLLYSRKFTIAGANAHLRQKNRPPTANSVESPFLRRLHNELLQLQKLLHGQKTDDLFG